jgi:hypothetical protein
MSELGQKRRFDRRPVTSGLPRLTDILGVSRHVSNVPISEVIRIIRLSCPLAAEVAKAHQGQGPWPPCSPDNVNVLAARRHYGRGIAKDRELTAALYPQPPFGLPITRSFEDSPVSPLEDQRL